MPAFVKCFRAPGKGSRLFTGRGVEGFTLLELLVAMAVLSILLVAMVKMVDGTSTVSASETSRISALQQIESVVDRLEQDISRMPVRPDLDYGFFKTSGNDSLRFVSEVTGISSGSVPASTLSTVEYSLDPAEGMLRGVPTLAWNAQPFSSTAVPTLSDPANPPVPSAASRLVLGRGILRMEIGFVLADGTIQADPPAEVSELRGLVATMAAIDEKKLGNLSSGARAMLSSALADRGTNSNLAAAWLDSLNGPALRVSLGADVVRSIQVQERMISLQRLK